MQAVSLPREFYSPETIFSLSAAFPDGTDLSSFVAVFELRDRKTSEVVFRASSDVADSGVTISDEVVVVAIEPSFTSEGVNEGAEFNSVLPDVKQFIDYNLDLEATGVVDKRFQGEIRMLPSHGKFTAS